MTNLTHSFTINQSIELHSNLIIRPDLMRCSLSLIDLWHTASSTKKFVKRKVNNAVSARSPLIMSVLPPYNKMSYSKDKGLDRGIENLRLHIPPDVLLNLGVRSSGTGAANKDNDASPASGVSGSGNGGGGNGNGGGGTTSTKEKSSPASTPPTKSFNYLKLE